MVGLQSLPCCLQGLPTIWRCDLQYVCTSITDTYEFFNSDLINIITSDTSCAGAIPNSVTPHRRRQNGCRGSSDTDSDGSGPEELCSIVSLPRAALHLLRIITGGAQDKSIRYL
ncbi:hypothetical protein SCLCIDRAFT_1224487, partial [Scleroderma citrinum Foug A]